jgi:spore photoproduct lyase
VWSQIDELVVEAGAEQTATARRLMEHARRLRIPVVAGRSEAEGRARPDTGAASSKRAVRVVRYRGGAVLKPCTGRTDALLCCNLLVATQTVGCPLDCSYCILQAYQNRAEIVVQADPDPLLDAIQQRLDQRPRRLARVCTGQVADSLALEPEVGFAEAAVRRFASLKSGLLELKTKTDRVQALLGLPHAGHTVISWTLNPADRAAAEEHGAASLSARLAAASRAVEAGYLLAFHLDPLLTSDGDPTPFLALVDEIFDAVPRRRVACLSLGTVRFQPAMRRTVLTRFPDSRVTLGELLPDIDGKLRLVQPLRITLYRDLAARIRRCAPEVPLYLCMEPPRVWRAALGVAHASRQEVELALAASLYQRFGLGPCAPSLEDYQQDW